MEVNMETKFIFFDIDGTLFNEKTYTVPTSTKKAIQLAQANGHKCFINTGRPISSIDRVVTDIPFDGYICGCGTYIQYNNQEIFHHQLTQSVRQNVIQSSVQYHIDTVLEGKNAVYFPKVIYHPFVKAIQDRYLNEGFPIYEYSQEDCVEFDKFASWYTDVSDIDTFRKSICHDFDIIQRDIDFIEVVPHHLSKASGIQLIIDYLHNTIDNTISIGDSTNDLPMLTYTKESVAMGNSNPILFDYVTYITTDINNDGIYHALKHFKLI